MRNPLHHRRRKARTRLLGATVAAGAVAAAGLVALPGTSSEASAAPAARQAERLDRGVVSVHNGSGNLVSWRWLASDPTNVAFNVYRGGTKVNASPVAGSTNYFHPGAPNSADYTIRAVVGGVEQGDSAHAVQFRAGYKDVPITPPAGGSDFTYEANDASVGDLDGDGALDFVLKWQPTNAKDNAQSGVTGNTVIDGVTLDGTRLWRIDLGKNIRAGAHYTQFQVFDLDGDGKAEVTMKTADGTVDGVGTVIGDARADYRNSSGYVLTGPEFATVFNGATGAAVDTTDYIPARGDVGSWGDAYGNRVDRFLAGVAYLDGEKPSVLFSRGYYTRTVIAAYDFDGTNLTSRWTFDSDEAGDQYRGQGNHQFSVADVDNDQKDEIIFGSMTVDDDGTALHNTRLGHGDALHVSDFDPTRPGLEVFAAHEDIGASKGAGATYRDAATGEVLWSIPATRDTGRAAMADIDPRHPGAEGWAVGGDAAWNSRVGQVRSSDGQLLSEQIPAANFLTWWDGDLLREITDHDWTEATRTGVPTISKWIPETATSEVIYRADGTLTSNDTKGTPALQADLFGDWREEIVTRTDDSTALRIATTVNVTDHRLRTLQSDPVYRLGVAWQNTSYNQPPHTSYFLGEGMEQPAAPSIAYTGEAPPAGELVKPTGTPEAPAKDDLTDENQLDLGLGKQKFPRGASEVVLANLPEEQWVHVHLGGTSLSWHLVTGEGTVTVTTPGTTRPGDNRLVIQASDGTLLGWDRLKVVGSSR